ncbi:hypothetical protein [Streptacidiphilus carbonis]|jgi:hypothetical protein|uniref:hypothetical protein n=1 Tax=Streptacidiphilus carbonis TaxID=105422 RepID=UPI0005A5EF06|nr:hypothetical protein [Streptacidiphilus carbonis]
MFKSRSARGLVVAAAAAAALAVGVGTAGATTYYGDYTASGVALRSTPYTNSPAIYGRGYPGQHEYDYCYTGGSDVNGNYAWDWNKDAATGVSGYSTEVYLNTGSEQFTSC